MVAHRRIPTGEWIMVTGANGYIASHIVDILLQEGYYVRGTVRSHEEAPWLKGYFADKYGKGKFETAIVSDLTDAEAFERAAANMSGVIHTASILPSDSDVEAVVPSVIAGTLNALNAAAKYSSVKSFVLTSSSVAACLPEFVREGVVVNDKSWNDAAVAAAYSNDTPRDQMPLMVYAASKCLGERALWQWVRQEKPKFVVNAVLPNFNMGRPLTPDITTGSMHPVRALLKGADPWVEVILPQYFVDVRDNARLHVAALLDATVQSERIFAFAEKFNWTDLVRILRKLRPENSLIPDGPENENCDLTNVEEARQRAEGLLKSNFGVSGWTTLEESVAKGIEGFE